MWFMPAWSSGVHLRAPDRYSLKRLFKLFFSQMILTHCTIKQTIRLPGTLLEGASRNRLTLYVKSSTDTSDSLFLCGVGEAGHHQRSLVTEFIVLLSVSSKTLGQGTDTEPFLEHSLEQVIQIRIDNNSKHGTKQHKKLFRVSLSCTQFITSAKCSISHGKI
ncbi:hypothetical protein PHYPO_G00215280 [Pangasianodon hypophthalmus]|uniref:Uncharacterized protein n=1 Tax=Pangasianodon hypophthalmus TaxID=310915 RepID=A0A5N5P5T7_PANHP|nr:hypothetical protein PHYPO_G00215280 [Pangasianodon hypophthalmus]